MTEPDQCRCTCGHAGCASNIRDKHGRPIQHGTANAYDHHGCRCADCSEAHDAMVAEARQRVNAATRAVARKHGEEWTSADLATAIREDLTATEAAVLLGRTMLAVKNIRKKCRADPKMQARLLGETPAADEAKAGVTA